MKINLFFILSLACALNISAQTQKVHILSVNDMHAAVERFPQLAVVVDSLRALYPDLLLLSAGDNRTGNPVNDMYPEVCGPMVALMNAVGFNYSTLGNHEFDDGIDALRTVVNNSNCRYLCANINVPDSLRLHIEPFHIIRCGDIRIALLGLVQVGENGYPDAHPKKFSTVTFRDPIEVAREYAWLRQVSDVFIVLSHNGFEDDMKFAEAFPEVDVIIGGHSHTRVDGTQLFDGVLITQAQRDLKYATETTITLENRKIVDRQAELINIADYSRKKPEIQAMVDRFSDNETLNRVLTTASEFTCKEELGCLMADAMRVQTNADIGVQNSGGVRYETKPAGNFTVGDVYRLDPFGNELVMYTLSGVEVLEMLAAVCRADDYGPAYVSGIRYEILLGKDNKEVKKVVVKMPDGSKFDRKRSYRVVMSSYIASVADYKKADEGQNLSLVSSDQLIKYLEQQEKVDYKGVKRIIPVKLQRRNGNINSKGEPQQQLRQPKTMLSFSYSRQGTMARGQSYSVTRNGDKALVQIHEYADEYQFIVDTTIFADLQAIIDKYKMYTYKESYHSEFDVLDGESWSFNVRYDDHKRSISSSGENEWPAKDSHKAFHEIQHYFEDKKMNTHIPYCLPFVFDYFSMSPYMLIEPVLAGSMFNF